MEELGMISGTAVCLTNTVTQSNQTMQTVNLIITIVVGVVTLAYTVYKWYKRAKQDGKITADEIKELKDDIKDVLDKDE